MVIDDKYLNELRDAIIEERDTYNRHMRIANVAKLKYEALEEKLKDIEMLPKPEEVFTDEI